MDAEMTSSGRMRWTIARLTQMDKHRIVHTDSTTTSSLSLVPILLLLVSSGLVHSESTSNVTIAPSSASPNVQARSENFLSPDIASLVNLTSVGFKGLVDSSGNEALINGDNDGVSESSKTRDDAVAERQRSLEGARSETTELRDSLAVTEILPEFADKEVRDEVVNLEDENDSREPTTVPTSSRKIEESKEEEKYDKDGSGEYDLNDIGRSNREYNFSLINDTNVNYYASTKNARVGDDVVVLGETDHQSIDSDANVVNGPSGSKLISAGQVATTVDNNDTSLLDEAATWKSLAVRGDEGSTRGDITESIRDDETNRQGPKQQTQEAVGVDSENNKDSMKNLDVTNRDKGSTDFEPYPYARGGKIHEDTSNGAETPTSTEDASALENTIGLKENNGGSIVTAAVSPSSFAVDSVNGTESPVQSNQEDRKNLWRTSLDSEKSDGYTTTPKIESTFPRGAFWNVSNFSEDTSLDYNESVKVWTTMMTTTDDESTKNSTIDPIVISGVATVQDEANNSSPVTMDNLSSAATSLPTVSSETMTKESLQLKDDAPFRVSTETSTTNEATSPSSFSTATLERLTNDIATDDIRETEESLRSELPIESTTAGVEYEFIGLTESTSPKYIDTTSTEDQSSAATSSIETSTLISTSLDSSYSLSTLSTEEAERFDETSTNPPSTTVETETVTDYTVDSSSSDSAEPETTKSWSETATTSVEDSQSTTASLTTETNFEVSPSPTTENGRFVDSSTVMIPEISTISENSSSTLVQQSESPGSSMDVNETTESTRYPVTSANPPLVSPTEPSSSTPRYSDINFETEEKGKVTSRPGGRAISEKEATILVRIIFEGTWLDVCPYLPALRQSLADLLTSGLEKTVLASQIIYQKNPCSDGFISSSITTEYSVTMLLLYVVDKNGNLDAEMTKILPSLYNGSPIKQQQIRTFQLVQDGDSSNAIAVVVVSCVALICLVLLAGLLFIMRKRQTRFNYGERCRPVSLDAYSLDSVSAYNSVRGRKTGAARASKRSYGNPTFEDSTVTPSHPLNFAGLSAFCDEREKITEEFATIPQVTARIDELPNGAEVKNRYANVVPLPETRVSLARLSNDPLTEYINASYVRGPKNATRYYIACQAPMESTVMDFWRMIWEQQSKVIIMLTDLVENGVEKCAEYVPPSEVTDCHRLYGDYQVTLKKRETKERYAISTLHLKNLESNTFREVFHIWYLWPTNGMQSDAAGLIAVLLEARALQRGGPGPVVVHCSPGTGRTGTLIALDLTIRQYEITRTVDVPRVVCTIRRDRAGAVQTKEQYGFIYKALNLYATKLAGGALES